MADKPRIRGRLFRKYVGLLMAVVAAALIASGGLEIWFSYQENKDFLIRIQREQAQTAAIRIGQFVHEIEGQLGWTTQLSWSAGGIEQRRFDALRLLRQVPAVTELAQLDAQGREQLRVSRLAMDVIGSLTDLSREPQFTEAVARRVYYGPVTFRRDSEPYMTLAVAGNRRDAGVSVAEVNLKFIWDVVSQIQVGRAGSAYVVDAAGRLIAHPDISRVLRNTDLSSLAQVQAARRAGNAAMTEADMVARDMDGRDVIAAAAAVPATGWMVFVELPLSEALAPILASAARTGILLLVGLVIAFFAGLFLVRRLVGPIQALQRGAAEIGAGALSRRIDVKTGDELEALAQQFNDMTARLQESHAGLERKVAERTAELARSVAELRALGEVSQAVNSTLDLPTVLTTIVAQAVQLSGTEAGAIYVYSHGHGAFRMRASYGTSDELAAAFRRVKIGLGETAIGEAAARREAVQVPDIAAMAPSRIKDLLVAGGYRAILVVPLLRPDEVVGALVIRRKEHGEFPRATIDLLSTFAAQSVLAIQNARLFSEIDEKGRQLARSLDELRNAQDRLVQTEKLASLGQLTAGIAHEIKNPLNFVNNFAAVSVDLIDELEQLLDAPVLDAARRSEIGELAAMLKDNLAKVTQHGKRADSIVKNMLLHSREGSGERRPVDVNALLEESVNLAYHGARAENRDFNITIERALDPAAGRAELYPQEITRVLLNLIANGFYAATKRKAQGTESGYEPTLTAATRDLGDAVEIRIRDNGTGIPPEVKAKIFNPFFTTKPPGEGTGLGLSLSHDIVVKQHGGKLAVDTEPGQYTEFRIVLPRAAAAPAAASAAAAGGRA